MATEGSPERGTPQQLTAAPQRLRASYGELRGHRKITAAVRVWALPSPTLRALPISAGEPAQRAATAAGIPPTSTAGRAAQSPPTHNDFRRSPGTASAASAQPQTPISPRSVRPTAKGNRLRGRSAPGQEQPCSTALRCDPSGCGGASVSQHSTPRVAEGKPTDSPENELSSSHGHIQQGDGPSRSIVFNLQLSRHRSVVQQYKYN